MSYLISVIIPTKNRQMYCVAAVRQIMSLNKDIEICVQDNSDTDSLRSEFEGLKNLKYNHHKGVLSFVDNFSEAISLATGKYCCMIGDDDGILPNIINAAEYMLKNGVDALIPGLNVVYFWPSDKPINDMYRSGCLIDKKRSDKIHAINPINELSHLMKNGGLNYLNYKLPKLYHGLIRRDILEKIKEKTGTYFRGLTPDIYMATALSFVCKKVIYVNVPVTVSGICPTSGSTDSATGKHTGSLQDAPHFRGHKDYHWEESVPAFYSVETIWTESFIKAVKDFDEDLVPKIELQPLYEKCLDLYPQYSDIIIKSAVSNKIEINNRNFRIVNNSAMKLLKRIYHRVVFGKPIIIKDVPNIESAVRLARVDYIKD